MEDLTKYLKYVFLGDRNVLSVEQLHGGAQKVVYKVNCDDGFTCIVYVWDPSKNYVLANGSEMETELDPLGRSYGADLFEHNQKYLTQLGIRCPEIYYIDRTKSRYSFDLAIVEDIGHENISNYIQTNPGSKIEVLETLNAMLQKMHGHRCNTFGQLNQVKKIHNQSLSCEQVILNQTLLDLDHVAQHVASIAENKNRLTEVLLKLYGDINPRREYGLIHGELGPDHVRVDSKGQPVLIDIEGARFFDTEYEHSFLEFRFGEYYHHLRNDQLDPRRGIFYKLHLHISYSSGPLEIIERGFPQADLMKGIVQFNVESSLRFLK